MDKKLQKLEKQYMEVPIPKELDFVVESALKQGRKRKKSHTTMATWISGCGYAVYS